MLRSRCVRRCKSIRVFVGRQVWAQVSGLWEGGGGAEINAGGIPGIKNLKEILRTDVRASAKTGVKGYMKAPV